MTRNPDVRAKIARAMLVALVPFTICVQVALAHASPIVQTFRNNATLTAFSGTFEVIWPLQVTSLDAVIELRDATAAPLLQALGGDAVESPYPCPTTGGAATCSRIHISSIPELGPGSYAMYWRVTHLDGYVEQRVARFVIDPLWVAPSPTVPVSPSLTPPPSASLSPSTSPRPTSSVVATASLAPSEALNSATPTATALPSNLVEASVSPSTDVPGDDQEAVAGAQRTDPAAVALLILGSLAMSLLIWRRLGAHVGR